MVKSRHMGRIPKIVAFVYRRPIFQKALRLALVSDNGLTGENLDRMQQRGYTRAICFQERFAG
jgi:hypothetical protein